MVDTGQSHFYDKHSHILLSSFGETRAPQRTPIHSHTLRTTYEHNNNVYSLLECHNSLHFGVCVCVYTHIVYVQIYKILDDTMWKSWILLQKQKHVLPATKITEIENKNVQFDVKSNTCGVLYECDFYALYTTLNGKS